jgi:hypothetical protein
MYTEQRSYGLIGDDGNIKFSLSLNTTNVGDREKEIFFISLQ